VLVTALAAACADGPPAEPPPQLADTGLYADFRTRTLAPGVLPFSPQYPLWTDGAAKRRWIALPEGTAIDARDVDHWEFPIGTRLWKEFAFDRPVETRFMERRADGSWSYAAYVWSADGERAVRAPDAGVRNVCATADGQGHDVPSAADCRLCHEGTSTPVLGFSALQLSSDRDPHAPHAPASRVDDVTLASLVATGRLANLAATWQRTPPRIAARTPQERAALGYLHGNCSSCHNAAGPLQRLNLRFDYPLAGAAAAPAITTTLGVASRFVHPQATARVEPGAPERSVVFHRLAATDALTQMPPFGRHLADREALTCIERWIADLPSMPVSFDHQRPQPTDKDR
jgi:mono/diheme cytochrome c family protein